MEATLAAVVGFYPAFHSLSASSFFFIFLHLSLYQTTLSKALSFPFLFTFYPSMPVFKVPLLPSLPLASLLADSRAVSRSATRGPVHTREEKETSLLPTPCQCIVFQHRKKSDFVWRLFFFLCFGFKCCKKHKLLSVCQDLHPKRNYYYVVGFCFFFCFIIIYHFKWFSNWPSKVWATETFWAKNNFYGILRKCWKYYDEFILLKMCTYPLLFSYLLIIFPFHLIWAKERKYFCPPTLLCV